MKYVVRIDRPRIDDAELDIECESQEDAAMAVVSMVQLGHIFENDFFVISIEETETHCTVRTSSGTIRAFPKMKDLH